MLKKKAVENIGGIKNGIITAQKTQ